MALETLSAANSKTQAAIAYDVCHYGYNDAGDARFSLSKGEKTIYDLILKQLDDEARGVVKMTGDKDVDGMRGWLEDKFCEAAATLGLAAETN
jgi:hypothetical protein